MARGRGQELEAGAVIGHFRIEAEAGRGGMGVVYRAIDTKLDRRVALKVLPTDRMGDTERRQRFVREAKIAAAVNHPNVAMVFEVGGDDQTVYIALEYVDGKTLSELISAAPLAVERVIAICRDIASALAVAHAAGVIHRDLKPGNVMIDERGVVKLLDFGLAKSLKPAGSDSGLGLEDTALVTRESAILGTPAYMSPEQCRGGKLDQRSDVFSFGTLLYELLAGRRPFVADSAPELGIAIMRDEPPSLSTMQPQLPEALIAIVERCMKKAPADRYADGAALVQAIEGLRSERQTTTSQSAKTATARASVRHSSWAQLLTRLTGVVVLGGLAWWFFAGRAEQKEQNPEPSAATTVDIGQLLGRPLTRVRAPRHVNGLAITPDGKRVAYQQDGTSLSIHDIGSDDSRRVRTPTGIDIIFPLDFFPDGQTLLVAAFASDGSSTLSALDLETSALRTISSQIAPRARISPDGKLIAFRGKRGVSVIPASGGEPRQLKKQPPSSARQEFTWSPNGAHLAITREGIHLESALEIVSVDGRQTQVVPAGGKLIQANGEVALQWLPDGRILFARDGAGGSSELWDIAAPGGVWDGRPPRHRTTIKDGNVKHLRYAGGRYAFLKARNGADVRLAELAKATVSVDATTRLTNSDGYDTGGAWTYDGHALFTSDRDGNVDVFAKKPGGPAKKIAGGPGDQFVATAFGTAALVFERFKKPAPGCRYFRVDNDRRSQFLETRAGADDPDHVCAPIVCALNPPHGCVMVEDDGTYRSIDPRTGKRGPGILRKKRSGNVFFGLSPGGTKLAWAQESDSDPRIVVLDLTSGTITKQKSPNGFIPHDVSWRADGKGWLVSGYYPGKPNGQVVSISLSGALSVIVTTPSLVHNPVASPDGRYVSFNADRIQRNVWVFEPSRK